VFFVSHNMGAITRLCERTLWLDDGQLKLSGVSTEVVAAYLSAGTVGHATWTNLAPAPTGIEVQLKSARLLSSDDQPMTIIDFSSPFRVEIGYDVFIPTRDLSISYQLSDSLGNLVFEAMDTDMAEWKGRVREPSQYRSTCEIPKYLLKPGRYHLSITSFIEYVKIVERQEGVLTFDVSEVGYCLNHGRLGVVSPVLEWRVIKANEMVRLASDQTQDQAGNALEDV